MFPFPGFTDESDQLPEYNESARNRETAYYFEEYVPEPAGPLR